MLNKNEIVGLFHTLWTKSVGTPGYKKAQWLEFEAVLHRLLKALP